MSVGGTSFIGFRYIAPGPGLCLDKTKTKMPLITSNIDLFIVFVPCQIKRVGKRFSPCFVVNPESFSDLGYPP